MSVPAIAQLFDGPSPSGQGAVWKAFHLAAAWVGLLLPFASFAGGLAAFGKTNARSLAVSGMVVSCGALVLLGYVSPHLEYRVELELGLAMEERFPAGPATLRGLADLRERVAANPPERFSWSAEHPLQQPPEWLTFRIHSPISLSLFAIFAVFLGSLTGSLTTGLSPPARKNARWAIGLVSGVLFFFAQVAGDEWVRADPQNSGILGAWVPMLIPALELGLLYFLLVRARVRATVFSRASSDG